MAFTASLVPPSPLGEPWAALCRGLDWCRHIRIAGSGFDLMRGRARRPPSSGDSFAVLGTGVCSIQVFAPQERAGVQLNGRGGLDVTQSCRNPFLQPLEPGVFCQMGANEYNWGPARPLWVPGNCSGRFLHPVTTLSCPFFSFITLQQRVGDQIYILDGTHCNVPARKVL